MDKEENELFWLYSTNNQDLPRKIDFLTEIYGILRGDPFYPILLKISFFKHKTKKWEIVTAHV